MARLNLVHSGEKMRSTNIHEAKTHLSKWVELAAKGEEIIICKSGKPMAMLVPIKFSQKTRKPGFWQGKVSIKPGFDELPSEFMEHFT